MRRPKQQHLWGMYNGPSAVLAPAIKNRVCGGNATTIPPAIGNRRTKTRRKWARSFLSAIAPPVTSSTHVCNILIWVYLATPPYFHQKQSESAFVSKTYVGRIIKIRRWVKPHFDVVQHFRETVICSELRFLKAFSRAIAQHVELLIPWFEESRGTSTPRIPVEVNRV